MSTRQRSVRSTELAKIHIAAEQLGLRRVGDDSAYRDMLWTIGRVRSAADLDAGGRQAVLAHLRRCGFADAQSNRRGRYAKGSQPALIRWLWTRLHEEGAVRVNSDRALHHYIGQHSGLAAGDCVREIAPQHLDERDANKVIEQLKLWLRRVEHANRIARKGAAA